MSEIVLKQFELRGGEFYRKEDELIIPFSDPDRRSMQNNNKEPKTIQK